MLNVTGVQQYNEPIEILKHLSDSATEMTNWQLGFLCGLLKEYKPKKIVEIGVAAGGTSAIIINCINKLGIDSEIHSIDLSEFHYKKHINRTGYLAEEAISCIGRSINYNIHLGDISVAFLDEIGRDIDFLILDTVHFMPGELLDFLACYPYLSSNAVVVLHDVNMQHIDETKRTEAISNQILFSSVVAERLWQCEPEMPYELSNIAAFKVNADTEKYIDNVITALNVTWDYMPDFDQCIKYQEWFKRFYSVEQVAMIDRIFGIQGQTVNLKKETGKMKLESFWKLLNSLEKENYWIYGYGNYARKIGAIIENFGYNVNGYIVSDTMKKTNEYVKHLSEVRFRDEDSIIVGVSSVHCGEILDNLKNRNLSKIITLDEGMCILLEELRM